MKLSRCAFAPDWLYRQRFLPLITGAALVLVAGSTANAAALTSADLVKPVTPLIENK